MTFKHIQFEDSVVMRSLEKLAHDKGLIKETPVVKTASINKPTKPASNSLTEKIIFLCSQLRTSGFEKHALEIESKLMAFKQANTLYETSSEKGEDLVGAAHPKGSYKLEGVEGGDLAVIETIVDQQLKNIQMTEKKPTGKLSSNKSILSAVKTVLAQAVSPEMDAKIKELTKSQLAQNINNHILNAYTEYSRVKAIIDDNLTIPISIGWAITFNKARENPTVTNIKNVISLVNNINTNMWARLDGTIYKAIQPGTDKALKYLNNALVYSTYLLTAPDSVPEPAPEKPAPAPAPVVVDEYANFLKKIEKQLSRVSGLESWLQDEGFTQKDREQGGKWIEYFRKTLGSWKNVLSGITDPDQRIEIVKSYESKLTDLIGKMAEFETQMKG